MPVSTWFRWPGHDVVRQRPDLVCDLVLDFLAG